MAFKMAGFSPFNKETRIEGERSEENAKSKVISFIKKNINTMTDEEIMSNPVVKNYPGEVNWNKNGEVEFH